MNNGTADWRTAVYPVESSQTYRCGVWVKGAADLVTVLAVRWFSNPEGTEYITETWVVLQGANINWTRYQQEIVAPVNAQSGDLMFRAAFATTINVLGIDLGDQVIRCTEDHLIYVEGKGYVKAIDLCDGDIVLHYSALVI